MAKWVLRPTVIWSGALLILAPTLLRSAVALAPIFSDGVVLQRNEPIRVWGTAEAGEKVAVEFGGKTVATTTGADGRWIATLASEAPSTTGRELRVRGQNALIVHDVLVGDVWICSGQSNMEFVVKDSLDAAAEMARSRNSAIRQLKIARHLAEEPVNDFTATPWRSASPETVGAFTAVGYYFAREMFAATGVPVGLVNCTWSGTPVEPWMSAEALAEKPEFAVVAERWRHDLAEYPERRKAFEQTLAAWKIAEANALAQSAAAHAAFLSEQRMPRPPATAPDHPYPSNPSAIFNGMVHPLRQLAVRGVLWYQGEANALRASEYAALFQANIRGWRRAFDKPELPFFWVQIANFAVETDWPRLREAQTKALVLPATGQAVAIDIGDPSNIHPANKQEVGRRLALLARAQLEKEAVEFSGPVFARVEFSASQATVRFTHAAGLNSRSGAVMSLELAGGDRIFRPAEGRIDGEILRVSSAEVPAPVALRYAWSASPRANLYNLAGLPAAPFRTDDW